jgi:hypothetical protein
MKKYYIYQTTNLLNGKEGIIIKKNINRYNDLIENDIGKTFKELGWTFEYVERKE